MPPRIQTAAFHAIAAAFFGACVPLMLEESRHLEPWFARVERLLALAAAVMAASGLRFLVSCLVTRPTAVVRGRNAVYTYLLAMGAAVVLATVAVQALSKPYRPVLAAFLVGAAVWQLIVWMDVLPQWFVGPRLLVDRLGRTMRLEKLTWAELRPQSNQRAALTAGDERRTRLRLFGLRQDLEQLQARILEDKPKS